MLEPANLKISGIGRAKILEGMRNDTAFRDGLLDSPRQDHIKSA
jgi:hypothetical protein